jgi:hypothetical protein
VIFDIARLFFGLDTFNLFNRVNLTVVDTNCKTPRLAKPAVLWRLETCFSERESTFDAEAVDLL